MPVSNIKDKILLITILLVLIVIGCFIATEITAFKFHFQEALGKPTRLGNVQLYPPFQYFKWYSDFSEFLPNQSVWLPGFICLMITAIFSIAIIAYFKYGKMKSPFIDTYGSAHWASENEIKDSGLLNQTNPLSCYVGAWQKSKNTRLHYLRFAGPEHIFAYAPTRSGKGVGLVIPTLLSYQGSMIISDFKGENWHITAGWRKSINHTVLKFDPTSIDGKSARFNPLLEVRPGIHEVRDIQNIVDMISDPLGSGKNDHWTNAANDILVCLILHVLYAEKNKSLTGVREFISNPYSSETEIFESMLTTRHDPEKKYHWADPHTGEVTETHPVVAAGSKDMLNKSSEERSGIMSTLKTLMKLYRDPIIAQNTSGSDFRIHDLVYAEKPCSLYLVIPPGDINRTMPLMRLVLNQILTRLTESLEINSETQRHPLKLLLDEFPQFGKLEFLEKGLAYLAGYNISAYLIAQDLTQVYSAFGHYQSIIANCGVRIAYAPNTIETAKHLSTLLGSKTLVKEQFNYSGERFSFLLKNINVNQHETRRELLTPDELMRLPDDVAIIFKTGHSPIYGRKIRYYSDPILSARTQMTLDKSDRLEFESEWSFVNANANKYVDVETNGNYIQMDELQIPSFDEISESLI